jgi:hypothetical protein
VSEPRAADELAVLLGSAAASSRNGDHAAARIALGSAVGLAPDDRTAHRRLAAARAVGGDLDGARREYHRFITRLELRCLPELAATERSYAASLLAPRAVASPAVATTVRQRLTADQSFALRRVAVATVAIAATVIAMLAAGAEIFARGGPL